MKIALAQMEVLPGRVELNVNKMLFLIKQAKKIGVDLIAFPEMCLSGYLLGDKWTEEAFCRDLMHYNEIFRKASEKEEGLPGIAIAYGNIFLDSEVNKRVGDNKHHPNKDGRTRKYNAVYIFQNGKAVMRLKENNFLPAGVQPKTLLPSYRFFDDPRYFFSMEDIAKDFAVPLDDLYWPYLIEVKGEKIPIGFEICEDLWCEDYRMTGEALNVTKILLSKGARAIVSLSASPWTYGKNAARDRKIQFLKRDCGEKFAPFFYVNNTGAQNNGKNIITFDGGSTVYNSQGVSVQLSKAGYEEELLINDTEEIYLASSAVRTEKSYIAQKLDALLAGIKHLKNLQKLSTEEIKFMIGLSGGVDSSVVAAVLCLAAGKENVIGVNMPTEFNSKSTKDAARQVAEQLGITYFEIPIADLTKINEKLLDGNGGNGTLKLNSLQKGNLAAKIRGTNILSNLAARYQAFLTNNGNKLEVALGYATLYGDVNGAIAVIADLSKPEVFALGKYLNEEIFKREVIPNKLFPDHLFRFAEGQIVPSAELEENQIDPMKFGYHDALLMLMTDYRKRSAEDFLLLFKEGTLTKYLEQVLQPIIGCSPGYGLALMQRWGVDDAEKFIADIEWFFSLVQRSVFKRVQAPPIIITSKTAYGYDLRESQLPWQYTQEYLRLKEEVLRGGRYVEKLNRP